MRAFRFLLATLALATIATLATIVAVGGQPKPADKDAAAAAADSAHVADSLRTLAQLELSQRTHLAHCALPKASMAMATAKSLA